MRHRKAGRHLSRTSAHRRALRRNMAQSLFEFGEIRTTLEKAKEVRPFVERLITLARDGSLRARQRVLSMLNDRGLIPQDQQEAYDGMTDAQRHKVLRGRSGRRIRAGSIPASYNKKKIPFTATSVVHKLFTDIAPRFKDRPGGYTRILRLSEHRIGDNGRLAILQLVGSEQAAGGGARKAQPGRRKVRAESRQAFADGKIESKRAKRAAQSGKAGPVAGGEEPKSE